jgi:hypothetical protein
MYSYLATKHIPSQFRRLAWYAPTFVVVFAAVRALGLGLRQAQLMRFMATAEAKLLTSDSDVGWAKSFICGPPYMSTTAGVFYIVLAAVTIAVAHHMSSDRGLGGSTAGNAGASASPPTE